MHVVDKIRKLLAMAENSPNEAEAALFAEKAAELLAAHNLSMTDIRDEEKGEISEHHWKVMYLDPWRRRLIRASAQLYFCDTLLQKWWDKESHQLRPGIVIVGRPHNVFISKEMSNYLISTTLRLAGEYAKKHVNERYTERKTRLAFERGCGEKLAWRLGELRKAKSSGMVIKTPSGNPGNLPALYTQEAELTKSYIDALGLKNAKIRGSDLSTIHSGAGMKAANAISLEPQLTTKVTHLLEEKV